MQDDVWPEAQGGAGRGRNPAAPPQALQPDRGRAPAPAPARPESLHLLVRNGVLLRVTPARQGAGDSEEKVNVSTDPRYSRVLAKGDGDYLVLGDQIYEDVARRGELVLPRVPTHRQLPHALSAGAGLGVRQDSQQRLRPLGRGDQAFARARARRLTSSLSTLMPDIELDGPRRLAAGEAGAEEDKQRPFPLRIIFPDKFCDLISPRPPEGAGGVNGRAPSRPQLPIRFEQAFIAHREAMEDLIERYAVSVGSNGALARGEAPAGDAGAVDEKKGNGVRERKRNGQRHRADFPVGALVGYSDGLENRFVERPEDYSELKIRMDEIERDAANPYAFAFAIAGCVAAYAWATEETLPVFDKRGLADFMIFMQGGWSLYKNYPLILEFMLPEVWDEIKKIKGDPCCSPKQLAFSLLRIMALICGTGIAFASAYKSSQRYSDDPGMIWLLFIVAFLVAQPQRFLATVARFWEVLSSIRKNWSSIPLLSKIMAIPCILGGPPLAQFYTLSAVKGTQMVSGEELCGGALDDEPNCNDLDIGYFWLAFFIAIVNIFYFELRAFSSHVPFQAIAANMEFYEAQYELAEAIAESEERAMTYGERWKPRCKSLWTVVDHLIGAWFSIAVICLNVWEMMLGARDEDTGEDRSVGLQFVFGTDDIPKEVLYILLACSSYLMFLVNEVPASNKHIKEDRGYTKKVPELDEEGKPVLDEKKKTRMIEIEVKGLTPSLRQHLQVIRAQNEVARTSEGELVHAVSINAEDLGRRGYGAMEREEDGDERKGRRGPAPAAIVHNADQMAAPLLQQGVLGEGARQLHRQATRTYLVEHPDDRQNRGCCAAFKRVWGGSSN